MKQFPPPIPIESLTEAELWSLVEQGQLPEARYWQLVRERAGVVPADDKNVMHHPV